MSESDYSWVACGYLHLSEMIPCKAPLFRSHNRGKGQRVGKPYEVKPPESFSVWVYNKIKY